MKYRVFLEHRSKNLGWRARRSLFLFTSKSLRIGQKLNTNEKMVF